ncbi:MAG: nicotinate-nucleotide adenylyltransferase [Bacteroidetes bacterium]|nr:nicotinate-nucleotide adenylyltransferase [Bacteroidota bacterium]MBL6944244.1 nicotinate-nucleotide adenylyltransferase [Bacteroidales bacterium]
MKKTGLLFGSFNPIHNGHLILANFMAEFTELDEVWFVVSPLNPLKNKKKLLADYHRLALVRLAVEKSNKLKAANIEFSMPQPSYTIDTLTYLTDYHPEREFVVICGTDIFPSFHKWKNYNEILNQYRMYVYPRPGYQLGKYESHPSIALHHAPLLEISSSFIRKGIKLRKNMSYWMPEEVYDYILEMHFYDK